MKYVSHGIEFLFAVVVAVPFLTYVDVLTKAIAAVMTIIVGIFAIRFYMAGKKAHSTREQLDRIQLDEKKKPDGKV
jgi:hypothetical protein